MKYNALYKDNKSVWGDRPNALLEQVYSKVERPADFLDLGCGQGRDSLFMLKNGFSVTAVDKSREGLNNISEQIKKDKLPLDSIVLVHQDAKDFSIEKDKFTVINAFNVLQFLFKADALAVVKNIKDGLISGGYAIISGFIDSDLLYQKNNQNNGFFKQGELKSLFPDFKILLYEEKVVDDPGHPGWPEPHQHFVVKMIAQKKYNPTLL